MAALLARVIVYCKLHNSSALEQACQRANAPQKQQTTCTRVLVTCQEGTHTGSPSGLMCCMIAVKLEDLVDEPLLWRESCGVPPIW